MARETAVAKPTPAFEEYVEKVARRQRLLASQRQQLIDANHRVFIAESSLHVLQGDHASLKESVASMEAEIVMLKARLAACSCSQSTKV
jgi:hypothetical protein